MTNNNIKIEALQKINSEIDYITRATENLYHGKVYVLYSNRIHSFYKTKRGAEGKNNRLSNNSYYDEYTMEMVNCGGYEVIEILENEIADLNSIKTWYKIFREDQGHIISYNNFDYYINAAKNNCNNEIIDYVVKTMENMKNNHSMAIIEEYENIEIIETIKPSQDVTNNAQELQAVTDGVTVNFNEDKNGIEILFSNKELATEEIRTALKNAGFRYYFKLKLWIAKQTPESLQLVNELFLNSNNEEITSVVEPVTESITAMQEIAASEQTNNIIGLEVVGNWGAMYSYSYGIITGVKNDIVTIDFDDEDYPEPFTTSINSLKHGDIKEIGVYVKENKNKEIEQVTNTIENINIVDTLENSIENDPEVTNWNNVANKYELINFENTEIIDTENKEIFVNILMPNLNKNCRKDLNDQEIKESSYVTKLKVNRIVKLNYKQYNYFINNLLKDYDFLTGQGGSWVDDDTNKFLYLLGVAVVCDGMETIIIDPQGYSYARYVGQLVEDINNTLQTELNTINTTININNNLYNESINSIINNRLYEVNASNKEVIKDNRYILNTAFNGVVVVTGKTLKELIQEGKGINILNLGPLKANIKLFIDGLNKHDKGLIFSMFPSAEDKQLESIKMLERLQKELNRAETTK